MGTGRLILAGLVGAVLAALIFVAVLYFTDLRITETDQHAHQQSCGWWNDDCGRERGWGGQGGW